MLKTVSKFPVLLSRPIQYGKYSKISNSSLFLFTKINKVFRAGIHKRLVSIAKTGKTLIRLLLQKQSDMGLLCLPTLFGWQLVLEILQHSLYARFGNSYQFYLFHWPALEIMVAIVNL